MTPLRLIWPPRELHPNARVHWSVRSKATRSYRTYAKAVTRTARLVAPAGLLAVELTFCPPDQRRRDLDGCQSACKAALDGIADALSVDDSAFRPRSDWGEVDPTGLGYVLVQVEPWEREARPIGELIQPIMADIAGRVERAA